MHSDHNPATERRAAHMDPVAQAWPGAWFRYVLAADGCERLSHLNEGCARIWEVDNHRAERDSKVWWALVDPQDTAGLRASIETSAKTLRDWSYEWRITTPSGRQKWLHGVARPIPLDQGDVAWNTLIVDITHSRRAECSVRDRFHQMLDGVSHISVQGYSMDLTTRYWNKASERLYGYTAKEAIGKNLLDLIIPEAMRESVLAAVSQMVRSGQPIPEGRLRLRRKNGQPVEVLSSHAYVEFPGHDPELYCIDMDLTAQREAQVPHTPLESPQDKSQKMAALGTLAGGVAHDFNNIVAAISGNVELALSDLGPQDPARTSVLEIRKASRRAKDLVKQILAFSGRPSAQRKHLRLHKAVEDTARLVRANLPPGFEMEVACEPETPTVWVDATQLEQVLLNLYTNAWQAVPKNRVGRISIRLKTHLGWPPGADAESLKQLGLGQAPPEQWAQLSVSDNGEGMKKATLARIFEPFFTTKPPGKGTGLGLAVVHGILTEHQALLDVQSEPGLGTTFTVYFPQAMDTRDVRPSAPEALMSDFGSLEALMKADSGTEATQAHIMFVDDDELMTSLMKRLLEKRGYRVSIFPEANSALREFCKAPEAFDLVITDYNMRGLNGLEFARAVKARSANTPVAIASGHLSEQLRKQAPGAGVTELIDKPDTVAELFAAIDRMAQNIPGQDPESDNG